MSGSATVLRTRTGFPSQSHLVQLGRSHSSSESFGFVALNGVSICDPQAGHASGTPRMCWITAEIASATAVSVVETAASASCQRELFVCVNQLAKVQAEVSNCLKSCRRSFCELPPKTALQACSDQALKSLFLGGSPFSGPWNDLLRHCSEGQQPLPAANSDCLIVCHLFGVRECL